MSLDLTSSSASVASGSSRDSIPEAANVTYSDPPASDVVQEPDLDTEPLRLLWEDSDGKNSDKGVEIDSLPALDFVIVPGVCGTLPAHDDTEDAWGLNEWVIRLAKSLKNESRIFGFEYNIGDLFSGQETHKSIRECASKLLTALAATIKSATQKRLIVFVAYDIGGTLAKHVLTVAALGPGSSLRIYELSRILVFSDCFHRSIDPLDMENKLARFLFAHEGQNKACLAPLLTSIAHFAKAILAINDQFTLSKIAFRSRIISIFSDLLKRSPTRQVFDELTGTMGVPFERRIAQAGNYYKILSESIQSLLRNLYNNGEDLSQLQWERKLMSLVPPQYPFVVAPEPDLISTSTEFRAWLDYNGPKILHVHGTHRIREISEKIFMTLDDATKKARERTIVLYFSFHKWDSRRQSIGHMLSTFLTQIFCQYPQLSMNKRFIKQQEKEPGWTEADLLTWLHHFRFCDPVDDVMLVISNFDQCTEASRKLFLNSFKYNAETCEYPWKVVLTSGESETITSELSSLGLIHASLAASDLDPVDTLDDRYNLETLSRVRPELKLHRRIVQEGLQDLAKCEPLIKYIIFEQICRNPHWLAKVSIQTLLGQSEIQSSNHHDDTQLEKLLDHIFRDIPEQDILRQLLLWVLYSVRPLTTSEIATVLCLGSGAKSTNFSPDLFDITVVISQAKSWLAGILEFESGEFSIRNPRIRDVLRGSSSKTLPGGSKYLWEDIRQTAHFTITTQCIDYLSQIDMQGFFRSSLQSYESEKLEIAPFVYQEGFISYALQAWPYHYSLSLPRPNRLLQSISSDLSRDLAKGFWILSNPVTRSIDCPETMFPLLAGFNILDAINPRSESDVWQGICNAALNNQINPVYDLLKNIECTETKLLDVLLAFSSQGDEKNQIEFLDYVVSQSHSPRNIPWPPALMYRTSWLGLSILLEKLLKLGFPTDPTDESTLYSEESPLYHATSFGDPKTIRTLIKHGADVGFRGRWNRTPLLAAAGKGHPEAVKTLVQEGRDHIEAFDEDGFTALYLASCWGNPAVVKVLLELGADPNMEITKDNELTDWTPLLIAAYTGFEGCVRLLIGNGAKVDMIRSESTGTALRCAAVQGHLGVCKILLNRGANPNISLINPPILLQLIDSHIPTERKLDILDLLLSYGTDIDAKSSDGFCALHYAARQEDSRLLELLLKRNPEIDVKTSFGATPLYLSVPYPKNLRKLLEKGANPDTTWNGFTPLMRAADNSYDDSLRALLDYHATADMVSEEGIDAMGRTALYFAVSFGSTNGVRMLVDHGANLKCAHGGTTLLNMAARNDKLPILLEYASRIDLDQTNENGWTCLHDELVPLDNLERLLNAGANLEIETDPYRDTPLTLAVSGGNMERVEFFIKKGANVNVMSPRDGAALHQACRNSLLKMIRLLIDHGADVNQRCEGEAGTPLQSAFLEPFSDSSSGGDSTEEIVQYLLDNGAEVSTEAGLLKFVINAAALRGSKVQIGLLLDRGANVNSKDDMGRLPIHFAAHNGIKNFVLILENGGDIRDQDNMGKAALHWAAQAGRAKVVQKIIGLLAEHEIIDVPDKNGWTPLCWAAYGGSPGISEDFSTEDADYTETIRLLIDSSADPAAVGLIADEKWTPLKIARFCGRSANIIDLLQPTNPFDHLDTKVEEYTSKEAVVQSSYCDACYLDIRGFQYKCLKCDVFDLCFKCYDNRAAIHPYSGHEFKQTGEQFKDLDADTRSESSDTSNSSDPDSE